MRVLFYVSDGFPTVSADNPPDSAAEYAYCDKKERKFFMNDSAHNRFRTRTRPRPISIRTVSFLCAAAVVTGAALVCVRAHRRQAEQQSLCYARTVFSRMAEDADAVSVLLSAGKCDARALSDRCAVICAYADLYSGEDSSLSRAAADAAQFYRALSEKIGLTDGTEVLSPAYAGVYRICAARCAGLLADMALTLNTSEVPDAVSSSPILSDTAGQLSALAASFAPDPLRIHAAEEDTANALTPLERYHGESIVTQTEAGAFLRGLPGGCGKFLSYDKTIGDGDVYLFSCKNGYAAVSVHGGHLLAYAFSPREAHSDADCVTRALSDGDLLECADAFLSSAGYPATRFSADTGDFVYEDRGGVRYYSGLFTYGASANGTEAAVGVRMCDGLVLYFSIK